MSTAEPSSERSSAFVAAAAPSARTRILDLLDTLRRQEGMTVLAVSHDPAVIERSDRTARIVRGRIAPQPGIPLPP
jgi:ABC-type glutathione transport system ATPase component